MPKDIPCTVRSFYRDLVKPDDTLGELSIHSREVRRRRGGREEGREGGRREGGEGGEGKKYFMFVKILSPFKTENCPAQKEHV